MRQEKNLCTLCIQIPEEMKMKIDAERNKSVSFFSRTSWILQAIEKHLNFINKKEKP